MAYPASTSLTATVASARYQWPAIPRRTRRYRSLIKQVTTIEERPRNGHQRPLPTPPDSSHGVGQALPRPPDYRGYRSGRVVAARRSPREGASRWDTAAWLAGGELA